MYLLFCTFVTSIISGPILISIMMQIGGNTWFHRIYSWAFVNPFVVYKFNTSVNWFGAFMIALALSLVCPFGAMSYWIYKLGWLFCKLCTVGRK
jgi:hypothetical protein